MHLPSGSPAERAAWWGQAVAKRVRLEPELRARVPEGAFLCVLPDSDPEVARHNLLATETHEGDVVLLVAIGEPDAFEVIVVSDDLLSDTQDDLLFGDAPPKGP